MQKKANTIPRLSVTKNRYFDNGNVSLHFTRKDYDAVIAGKPEQPKGLLGKKLRAAEVAQDILDAQFDILCIRDDRAAEERNDARGWAMFSFRTQKEYFLTEQDIETLLAGHAVKLTATTARKETKASMLWCPNNA